MINTELKITLKLNEKDIEFIREGIASLDADHIGRIFGEHCIEAFKRSEDGKFAVVIPVKLKEYLLTPGNVFDKIPGFVRDIVKQIADWNGRALKTGDDFGTFLKFGFSSSEYAEYKEEAEKFPEYHVARVFLESLMEKIRGNAFEEMAGMSQGSEAPEHLSVFSSIKPVYIPYELLPSGAEEVKETVDYKYILGK